MKFAAHAAAVATLVLAAGCGRGVTTAAGRTAPAPPITMSTAVAATDDRTGIPRVGGDDVTPPQITTRTTVIENRPAVVVTLADAVLFAFGSAELRPEAEAPLTAVVDLVSQHPGAQVEVDGHTDSVGGVEYNRSLSQQRAAAVADWLAGHGVPRAQLHATGYGSTRPVAPNDTDENRQRNRRVELTVRDA
jgi:outer membrane protein OmpA-like peptidoglycan-associated protein